jgi:hypothetical protein
MPAIDDFQKHAKSEEFNYAMIAASCYSAIEDVNATNTH